jgi:hypothetical protein
MNGFSEEKVVKWEDRRKKKKTKTKQKTSEESLRLEGEKICLIQGKASQSDWTYSLPVSM